MSKPRQLFLTQTTSLPASLVIFKVKREVFKNAANPSSYHIEGTLKGKSYQVIYDTYDMSDEEKQPIVEQLKRYKLGDSIQATGSWEMLSRVANGGLSTSATFNLKDFRRPPEEEVENDFGVPTSSVYVKQSNDEQLVMDLFGTHMEYKNAKLKVEDVRLEEVIERIIPSKRAADEVPRSNDERLNGSQRAPSETPLVGSSGSRNENHGNGEGSSGSHNFYMPRQETRTTRPVQGSSGNGAESRQVQNRDQRNIPLGQDAGAEFHDNGAVQERGQTITPPVQDAASTSYAATQPEGGKEKILNLGQLGDTFDNAITIDGEDEDMGEQAVPLG